MAGIDRQLMRETRAARLHLSAASALAVCSAAVIVAQAVLLANVIAGAAMDGDSVADLKGSLIALTVVFALRGLIGAGFEFSGRLGAAAVMGELRSRLARQLLLLRPAARAEDAPRTGELAGAAVQGVEGLEAYFAGYLPQAMLAATVPLVVLAWLAFVDPVATALLAVTAPLVIVFMVLIGKNTEAETDRRWQALSLLGAHFLDVVKGLPTLRLFRRESAQADTLTAVGDRYRRETMITLRTAFLSALVLESCAMIGTALVAAAVGIQLTAGALTLESGLVVLLLAPELFGPLRAVGQQFHAAADGTAAARRIFAVLDRDPGLQRATDPLPAPDPAGQGVRLVDVCFAYPDRSPVLDRVNLFLAPGETTVLVGPSGSGKTTIANLIMRLADPGSGAVTCAGTDLRDLEAEDWWRRVGWMPQRPRLFAGTVADNIRLARPDAGDDEVRRAAASAGAEEFIGALPQRFDTPVGDGGRRLSAGQTQRIALARVFLQMPALLVLDEPTAHLDPDTARHFTRALIALRAGRTTLVITHDPALVAAADHVYAVEAGAVSSVSACEPVRALEPVPA